MLVSGEDRVADVVVCFFVFLPSCFFFFLVLAGQVLDGKAADRPDAVVLTQPGLELRGRRTPAEEGCSSLRQPGDWGIGDRGWRRRRRSGVA